MIRLNYKTDTSNLTLQFRNLHNSYIRMPGRYVTRENLISYRITRSCHPPTRFSHPVTERKEAAGLKTNKVA